MANRDILAIGASAGGVDALRLLARELPGDLPASVLLVLHQSAQFRSTLDAILNQSAQLPASFAEEGQALEKGRIFIAPPGRHLLVDGERLQLGTGPRENYARPAIDPLLRSAALCCGGRSVGVVLTGTMGDGASGLAALKRSGGITVVQNPGDAAFPEMPQTALSLAEPDHVVPLAGMPALLDRLVRKRAGEPRPIPEDIRYEVGVARGGRFTMSDIDRIGRRSTLACPDCHGTLWEIEDSGPTRYRCHTGHAFTAEVLSLALDENLTRALGTALRTLEERIALARKLHQEALDRCRPSAADSWARKAREFEEEADIIRNSIRRFDEISAAAQG